MPDPLSLVASMVVDSGARWGECATPDQRADMEALLSPDGPRRHYWLRARGRSKTYDVGAATLAMMLSGRLRGGDELYAAAAGREQAGLLARKMRLIAEATPELAGSVEIQNFRVITPRTGAILDVIASDLATSWGKTPRWVFADEVANHDQTPSAQAFLEALLTSLPKRRDSVCVMATTPSSPHHWARQLWDSCREDPLWRCSVVSGPAPWQDPAELESERRRLPVSLWRRLFLCEWAEADDQLATLEQVRACTGHDGPLPPIPANSYVHGCDLSFAHDTTAVATCHTEDRDGRPVLILDRLRAWRPSRGRQVPLDEVAAYVTQMVSEFGGVIHADPYQGMIAIQDWRKNGYVVKQATFSPQENSRRASLLLSLIREKQLDLFEDPGLFSEITSLRLAEGSTPGVLKLTTDGSSQGHFDRAMALMLCAQELMSRPAGSYRDLYGQMTDCEACKRPYHASNAQCIWCRHPNPEPLAEAPKPAAAEGDTPVNVNGSSWAAAYYPKDAMRCTRGHVYDGAAYKSCPRCSGAIGSMLGSRGGGMPSLPIGAGRRY